MPMYEFYCDCCNEKFEVWYSWKSGDGINYLDDPYMQECLNDPEHKIEFLDSLYAPRPDDMWHGVMTDVGYFTSKKKWDDARHRDRFGNKRELYDVTNRGDREHLTKHVEREKKEQDDKDFKQIEKVVAQTIMDYDYSPDNTHIHRNSQDPIAQDVDILEMKEDKFTEQQIAACK
jgi:hypothetical protein